MSRDSDAPEGRDGISRPFFVLMSLFGALSIASRFDEVLAITPGWVVTAILFLHGPLLCVAALLESRMGRKDFGPTWMQIKDPWAKRAFTLSFTYLSVMVVQVFDLELGPVDPTPPDTFPLPQRAMWFAMFTFGMGFANYLAVVELVVPPLGLLVRPFRRGHLVWTVPIVALLGAGIMLGLDRVLSIPAVDAGIAQLVVLLEDPQVMVAIIVGPLLLGSVLRRRSRSDD